MNIIKNILFLLAIFAVFGLLPHEIFAQSVNPAGGFNYSVPIDLPPATVGSTPQISLFYDSQNGNGIAGIGWGLSGISAITRDSRYPINFDINDHYLFNGEKLIYNSADQTYHPEHENYLKLQRVNPNTSSSYWIVTKKDGTKLYFGNTINSSIDAVGKGRPLLWALSKVEDVNGNYYKIEYYEDTQNGDYYPKKIIYNKSAVNLPEYAIEFGYETRTDHTPGYNPTKIDRDQRLKTIEVKANGQLYTKYVLNYDYAPANNFSRLISVQRIGSNGASVFKTQTFEWSANTIPQNLENFFDIPKNLGAYSLEGEASSNYLQFVNSRLVDINGDGKTDFLYRPKGTKEFRVALSDGTKFDFENEKIWGNYTDNIESTFVGTALYRNQIFGSDIVDANGDGLPDFVYKTPIPASIIKVMENSGSNFSQTAKNIANAGEIYNKQMDFPQPNLFSAFLNSDDKLDFFYLNYPSFADNGNNYFTAFISNGNALSSATNWGILSSTDYVPAINNGRIRQFNSDVNGDGLTDFVFFGISNNNRVFKSPDTRIQVLINNGGKMFKDIELWGAYSQTASYYSNSDSYFPTVLDVNGDGLGDFAHIMPVTENGRQMQKIMVMKNSGSKFENETEWGKLERITFPEKSTAFGFGFFDITGDGLSDFVYQKDNIIKVMVNTGFSFLGAVNLLTIPSADVIDTNSDFFSSSFADVNGDGKPDFVYRVKNTQTLKVMLNKGVQSVRADLLTAIDNGRGGKYEIIYDNARNFNRAIVPSNSAYPTLANNSGMPLVREITADDGLGGRSTTRYEYNNGLFKTGRREDRKSLGFEWVKKINPDNSYTITSYMQDDDSVSEEEFDRLVKKQESYGSDNKLYSKVENEYDSREVLDTAGQKSKFVFVKSKTSSIYGENDAVPVVTKTEYEYDNYGLITKVTNSGPGEFDKKETQTKYTNDPSSYIFTPSEVTTYGYSTSNQWILDSQSNYYYNDKGQVTKKVSENGNKDATETFEYDNLGRTTKSTDPRSNSTITSYNFISNGNYTIASANALGHTSSVVSDLFGRVIKTTDANNISSKTQYHADFPWLVSREFAYENDTLPSVEYEYNFADKTAPTVVKVTGKKAEKEGASRSVADDTRPIVYTYSDGLGRVIQTKSLWKNNEWQTTDTYYDTSGRAFKTSIPYSWTGVPSMDTTTKDGQKHIISEFDAIGRAKKIIKPDNTFTRAVYGKNYVLNIDEKGHVTKTESLGSETNTYEYEGAYPNHTLYSKTTTLKRADGTKTTDPKGAIYTIKTDMLGNILEKDNPDTGKWIYDYDLAGNLIKQTDARQTAITFAYDSINRVKEKIHNSIKLVKYTYDKARLANVNYIDGSESFVYDTKGRVSEKTITIDNISKTFKFAYDTQDKVVETTLPNGEVVTNNYDGVGNLTSVVSATQGNLLSKSYNILGQTLNKTYGNGVTADFTYYDESGQSASREVQKNDFSYQLKCQDINKGSANIFNECFEYELNMQISQINDSKTIKNFVYDDLKRVVSVNSEEVTGYDQSGNITTKSSSAYAYKSGTNQLSAAGNFTFENDSNGNITKKIKNGQTIVVYTYSLDNQLTKIVQGGLTSGFAYFNGTRVKKTENGKTTYYFSPDFEVTGECSNVNYFEGGLIFAQSTTCDNKTELTYLLSNYQGSTVATADKNGKVIKKYSYDLFGKQNGAREVSGTNATGEWYVNGATGSDDPMYGNGTKEFPLSSIQKAIDLANSGQAIYVMPIKDYNYASGAIIIPSNKDNIKIIGVSKEESGTDAAVLIQGNGSNSEGIVLLGNSNDPLENVEISGNIEVARQYTGIKLKYAKNSKISGVKLNNYVQISIEYGDHNEISDNNMIDESAPRGVQIAININKSDYNSILRNTIKTARYGIIVDGSSHTIIRQNKLYDNIYSGILLKGVYDKRADKEIITADMTEISQNEILQKEGHALNVSIQTIWVLSQPIPTFEGHLILSQNNFCAVLENSGQDFRYISGSIGFTASNNYFGICRDEAFIRIATDEEINQRISVLRLINWQPKLTEKADITTLISFFHPADTNKDWQIETLELHMFVRDVMMNNGDRNMSTNAQDIWKHGGKYHFVDGSSCPSASCFVYGEINQPARSEPSPAPTPAPIAKPVIVNPAPAPVEQLYCGKTIDQFAKIIRGTEGNDNLRGGNADELILGFGGNDVINGGNGKDCIYGGAGNDTINGGNFDDEIHGGDGDDILNGGNHNDKLYGEGGNDTLNGGNNDDKLYGGSGNDKLNGGNHNDELYGNEGDDTLNGGNHTDTCIDTEGKNTKRSCEK